MNSYPSITAILGPTNTGKTWYALERMQKHHTGMIGFPLRLLARENYDKLVAKYDVSTVALVTGEEKIVPRNARYYCCTVEAMPVSESFDFVAIDEIQLCADPERGYIFTDRLLNCRGIKETFFMGAETIRPILQSLIKDIYIETRPRLSTLTHTGFKKLTRLPKRSVIVAFSIEDVYHHADIIRRQKGGAAIVMGALSPRTRNSQVDMFQSGEVDYIVATDAIGMGLNMDVNHVALASTKKFDGKYLRTLRDDELAQIAGRAGRHTQNGTFGITGYESDLSQETVEAIQTHSFPSIEHIFWRNSNLDFTSIKLLLKSLELKSNHPLLLKGRAADDIASLQNMMGRPDITSRAKTPDTIRLLWDVCQIPDFRKIMSDDHHEFTAMIFHSLLDKGCLDEGYIEEQINRFDNIDGDVDTLMSRLAHIRTWAYLTHKNEWMRNPMSWQSRTKEAEDNLSDALHRALMNRFVDKRNSLFGEATEGEKELLAGVKPDGTVVVEGHKIGILKGLKFYADDTLLADKGSRTKKIINTALRALKPEILRRIYKMTQWNEIGADTGRFTLHEDGQITWQDNKTNPLPGDCVAFISKGQSQLTPDVHLIEANFGDDAQKMQTKLAIQTWLQSCIKTTLAPLFTLIDEEGTNKLEGSAKGIAFQLFENLGVIHRGDIENLVPDLTPENRASLRQKRIKMGPILVFMPELVKPAAINLRALLWGVWRGKQLPMLRPADGRVSVKMDLEGVDKNFYRSIGYPIFGHLAIRIDMLDRVITDIYDTSKDWKFQAQHKYMEWLGCGEEDLYAVLESMGFKRNKAEETEVIAEVTEAAEEITAGLTATDIPVKSVEKPKLATFWLKKGRISDRPKPKFIEKPKAALSRKDKTISSDKKPFKGKAKPQKQMAQSYSASAKEDKNMADSPFAILAQLKK